MPSSRPCEVDLGMHCIQFLYWAVLVAIGVLVGVCNIIRNHNYVYVNSKLAMCDSGRHSHCKAELLRSLEN